jgi:hypothetical protein
VFGDVRWEGLIAFAAGLVAGWLFLYGLVPALQGPLARSMNGVDLTWLAGGLTAGGTYAGLVLARRGRREQSTAGAEAHDIVPARGAEPSGG